MANSSSTLSPCIAGGHSYTGLLNISVREVEEESISMGKQRRRSVKGPSTSHYNNSCSSLKHIPGFEWPFEVVLQLIQHQLEIDCTHCVALAFPPHPGRFAIVTALDTGECTGKEHYLECVGERMLLDVNTLGDILAYLAYVGPDAVNSYISSRCGVGRKLSPSKPKEVMIAIRPLFDTQQETSVLL